MPDDPTRAGHAIDPIKRMSRDSRGETAIRLRRINLAALLKRLSWTENTSIILRTTGETIMQLTVESFGDAAAATTGDEYLGRLYFAGVAAILSITLVILSQAYW